MDNHRSLEDDMARAKLKIRRLEAELTVENIKLQELELKEKQLAQSPENPGSPRIEIDLTVKEEREAIDLPDTIEATENLTARRASKRPARDSAPDEDPRPNIQSDQAQALNHLNDHLPSNHVAPSQAGGGPSRTTTDTSRGKAYTEARLFRDSSHKGKPCKQWTRPNWWAAIGARLTTDSTKLHETIINCKESHPAKWTPLEFLQRASYESILRQAGLCGYAVTSEIKITPLDLRRANEKSRRYEEKDEWSNTPQFRRVLKNERLRDIGGLYWREEELSDNYEEHLRSHGLPDISNIRHHASVSASYTPARVTQKRRRVSFAEDQADGAEVSDDMNRRSKRKRQQIDFNLDFSDFEESPDTVHDD
ncbi:hypothetical protein LTR84_002603 [Exophiala bonariae]|uniref:Uncharacterized protein n=1 Tax=Exophiala bonariae TaxID=1690606 RepID=A0AAV9NA81_9EURO|nr:hypothetical protein LTR84_002603 [Exophiala bonariae]